MLGNFWKSAENDSPQQAKEWRGGADYVVSKRPQVSHESQEQQSKGAYPNYENLGELPRSYGEPVLFGIARDPHTLFVYWEIDWHKTFGENPPADRKVYLRVLTQDGAEEIRTAVEPLAGNQYVPVSQARNVYQIDLGYEEPTGVWHSVATSAGIATPPDDIALRGDVDVATVPFHLSFQFMIDRFRAGKGGREALVDLISCLQARADNSLELTEEEKEVLRAIESGPETAERARIRESRDALATRARTKSILGEGATSRG